MAGAGLAGLFKGAATGREAAEVVRKIDFAGRGDGVVHIDHAYPERSNPITLRAVSCEHPTP
jgi:hypothetical protein